MGMIQSPISTGEMVGMVETYHDMDLCESWTVAKAKPLSTIKLPEDNSLKPMWIPTTEMWKENTGQ